MNLSFQSLGTNNTILIPECDNKLILNQCAEKVREIHDRFSVFKSNSEVSILNAAAGGDLIPIGADLIKVLSRAVYFSQLSKGSFDITSRPLTELWNIGRSPSIPGRINQRRAKSLVNYRDLLIDDVSCRAGLRRKGQGIDLGGIAKGFAADQVKAILLENGIRNALIQLGGNIIAMGRRGDGSKWKIGIQNPIAPTGNYIGCIEISDKSIVTSGSYERCFVKNDKHYHHILDPKTGSPAESDLVSVTVVGDCSMDMDALATSAFLLGIEQSRPMIAELNAQAIFLTKQLDIFATIGLEDEFYPVKEMVKGA